jgi:hypothetical protein
VRILLVNHESNEHLVYETYPLIVSKTSYPLAGACEETCFLETAKEASLRIELINASITIEELTYLTSDAHLPSGLITIQKQIKLDQNTARISKINEKIRSNGLKWTAGETPISGLPFHQREKYFAIPMISAYPPPPGEDIPSEDIIRNLQGAEYYIGGIFELDSYHGAPPLPKDPETNGLIDSFDWRNRHGADSQESPYYDGDPTGSGWITSVKNQSGCGSCWAFAATGATEALANLYFNQHLDLDLAEQDALSCSGAGDCSGGWPSITLDYYTNVGVVDEVCFPYTATEQPCENICTNPTEQIKISGKETFGQATPRTEEELKRLIIENGPISGGVFSLRHAMTLVGYTKDPYDGKMIWIFKNSWGTGYGENGYWRIKTPINNIGWTHALKTPVLPVISSTPLEIMCDDRDGDGLYNWGISPIMPTSCPQNISTEKDCDDSNFYLGPFLANGECSVVLQESIVDVEVPVKIARGSNLFDGDLATSWNNDGNMATAWFDVELDTAREITYLRLAPRVDRAYTFNVYVDGGFVGQYTTASASTVALQTFALPTSTKGTVVRVEANHKWFKVHEVELMGRTLSQLPIVDVEVPVKIAKGGNLFDGELATFWNNDGNMATAWFDVELGGSSVVTHLRLAPRVDRAYTFNVYVDGGFVGQYTTASASTVALQTFALPPGTVGTVVRVEANHKWFKVHEIELMGW